MKKKVWNHLLYDIITKTIKKTSIPIFPNKTTIIKKIDPITKISENDGFVQIIMILATFLLII